MGERGGITVSSSAARAAHAGRSLFPRRATAQRGSRAVTHAGRPRSPTWKPGVTMGASKIMPWSIIAVPRCCAASLAARAAR